ncbi:HNH endonuclease [Salinibacterium sp. ZJ450]|uniref:HNH endonuclease n=1 Tax=Salinibacterium sp. ZJ450 TaxID=2708338 RepID=UPI00141E0DC3
MTKHQHEQNQNTDDDRRRRLGPVERSIQTHDRAALLAHIQSKCDIGSAKNACWVWLGAKRENGYPYVGRARTNRLAHRVVAWAVAGFPGELVDFPHVHHLCGVRRCLNPEHLAPTTALINVVESSVRNVLLTRIRLLTDAIGKLDGAHSLLRDGWITSHGALFATRGGARSESTRFLVRRMTTKERTASKRQHNRELRFRQVLDVRSLVAAGMSRSEARAQVGMSRSAFYDWQPRLAEYLASVKS